jgi:PTH1 family peptidyl-tRNA hydrolase
MTIKLIVGLGNPGKDYQSHRHNVGFWFCDMLADIYSGTFKKDTKFFGYTTQITIAGLVVRLLKPSTFMNRSGQSIQALAKFYQLNADEILVIHDDLDLDTGIVKLKTEGGHGGHNGLRDTIKALNTKVFYRLRLGIGHPGNKLQVADYVLHSPNNNELKQIQYAMVDASQVIENIVQGNIDKAMQNLHTKA